jgi:hypothetical protein
LANWTLDGLEFLLKKTFPSRKEKGKQIHSKVYLVRYADDCAPRAQRAGPGSMCATA